MRKSPPLPPTTRRRQPDGFGKKADRKEMRSVIYNIVSLLRESLFLRRWLYFIWCHEAQMRSL